MRLCVEDPQARQVAAVYVDGERTLRCVALDFGEGWVEEVCFDRECFYPPGEPHRHRRNGEVIVELLKPGAHGNND